MRPLAPRTLLDHPHRPAGDARRGPTHRFGHRQPAHRDALLGQAQRASRRCPHASRPGRAADAVTARPSTRAASRSRSRTISANRSAYTRSPRLFASFNLARVSFKRRCTIDRPSSSWGRSAGRTAVLGATGERRGPDATERLSSGRVPPPCTSAAHSAIRRRIKTLCSSQPGSPSSATPTSLDNVCVGTGTRNISPTVVAAHQRHPDPPGIAAPCSNGIPNAAFVVSGKPSNAPCPRGPPLVTGGCRCARTACATLTSRAGVIRAIASVCRSNRNASTSEGSNRAGRSATGRSPPRSMIFLRPHSLRPSRAAACFTLNDLTTSGTSHPPTWHPPDYSTLAGTVRATHA